jgi:hypothetical protein
LCGHPFYQGLLDYFQAIDAGQGHPLWVRDGDLFRIDLFPPDGRTSEWIIYGRGTFPWPRHVDTSNPGR